MGIGSGIIRRTCWFNACKTDRAYLIRQSAYSARKSVRVVGAIIWNVC